MATSGVCGALNECGVWWLIGECSTGWPSARLQLTGFVFRMPRTPAPATARQTPQPYPQPPRTSHAFTMQMLEVFKRFGLEHKETDKLSFPPAPKWREGTRDKY